MVEILDRFASSVMHATEFEVPACEATEDCAGFEINGYYKVWTDDDGKGMILINTLVQSPEELNEDNGPHL